MADDPFNETKRSRLRRALEADSYAALSNTLMGDIVDEYGEYFEDIRGDLQRAGINTLFRTYVSQLFLTTAFTFMTVLLITVIVTAIVQPPLIFAIVLVLTAPVMLSTVVFTMLYIYPSQKAKGRKTDIENNLPFALNQMSAVASSGIPPSDMFKLLMDFDEYGEVSRESQKVIRKIELFGEGITTALRETANETPSPELKEVMYGMISTIETGGDLEEFLQEHAEAALFDYRLRREKQIENISTYASFYTALLIAAPLFLIAILSVMNIIGGNVLGLAIPDVMRLGVYVGIPLINIAFIVFLSAAVEDM